MIVCVDGTGPSDSNVYNTQFRHSFVNRIKNTSNHSDRIYHRGPGEDPLDGVFSIFGGRNQVSPSFVTNEISRLWRRLSDEQSRLPSMAFFRTRRVSLSPVDAPQYNILEERKKIFLTGYSRGGATVIDVARLLERQGLQVEAMFLFDAVARSFVLEGGAIPNNVRICYHAMRNPITSSRESFGNCGTRAIRPRGLIPAHFLTTHGGMGGVPWGASGVPGSGVATINEGFTDQSTTVTPAVEAAGMRRVESWMWPHLRSHGVV